MLNFDNYPGKNTRSIMIFALHKYMKFNLFVVLIVKIFT